jgi:hypothetical protein
MHRLTVLLVTGAVVAGAAPITLAQEPSRPTLTVTRFEGKLKYSHTADAGAELADAIATRVEESSCCRVMMRAFLPQAKPGQSPSLDTVRQAAAASRVKYVIAGRATTSRTVRRPAPPSIAAVLGQMGRGASPIPAGILRGPVAPGMPYPLAARPQPVTLVTLQMQIIDSASGHVLRTVTITRPAGPSAGSLVSDSPELSDALIRAIASVERERR